VLGDDGGFMAGLSMKMDVDDESDQEEHPEEELENLDDAEVRTATSLRMEHADRVAVVLSGRRAFRCLDTKRWNN